MQALAAGRHLRQAGDLELAQLHRPCLINAFRKRLVAKTDTCATPCLTNVSETLHEPQAQP